MGQKMDRRKGKILNEFRDRVVGLILAPLLGSSLPL